MASNYPLLPGFAPTQEFKQNYRKVSAQKQDFNRDVNNIEQTKYILPRQKQFSEPQKPSKVLVSTTHDHFPAHNSEDTSKLYQPDWVRLDRHVLRFYGFFKESVVESNSENSRNRKVKVLFYLEDNSVSINEEKKENSGIPQGIFLKRQKSLKSDNSGKFYDAHSFKVGEVVEIYGRHIYLYNCDDYTREFYEKLGCPQGPSEQYRDDQWTTKVDTKWVPQKDAAMKDYLEKKLGGGRVNSEKQFLNLDRKVLKFYATCEQAKYIVHFFLADDTIEIREVSVPNSGRDPFPVTVKRHKLPKRFALNQPGQTYAEQFLTAGEIQAGEPLIAYGRKYFIEDCDSFTHDYFQCKFGRDFPVRNRYNNGGKHDPNANIIIPPHNGIGSEEDSLGYIYRLVPKPPKKDFFQWVDQQISLRFNARFSSPKPEDTNRKFILTYYLNDNSLQIYEPPIRNSGMYEGKFLERNQYKRPEGDIYRPEHLIIGCDVKINGHWFHLSDCDEFTTTWYANNTMWE